MTKAKIYYIHPCDIRATRDEKMAYLQEHKFQDIPFEHIQPDKNGNWIDIPDNDFNELLVLSSKSENDNSLFKFSSNTVKTNRDDWVYDFNSNNLHNKIKYFVDIYNNDVAYYHHHKSIPEINDKLDYNIKWSRDLKNELLRKRMVVLSEERIIQTNYRPYVKQYFYSDNILNDVLTSKHSLIYGNDFKFDNLIINFSDACKNKPFHTLATKSISDYHFLSDTHCLPLYRYDTNGNRYENITDWGLEQFRNRYPSIKKSSPSKKQGCFILTDL